jgi:Acetyltransferases, including N-acetylases of ribosomal proteins
MQAPAVIETARMTLDAPDAADAAAITAALSDFDVAGRLARVPWPYRPEHAAAFLAHCDAARTSGEAHVYGLRPKGERRLLGLVGLQGLPNDPEIGYWLVKDAWGRGYATEAGRAMLDLAFDGLGLPAVRSGVFVGNDASLAVQRKLGFSVVGQSLVMCEAHGRALAHIDTRITRDDYEAGVRLSSAAAG